MFYTHKAVSVTVPSIEGCSVSDALKQLALANLSLSLISEKEEPGITSGTVLHQIPTTGSVVKESQVVYCIISKEVAKQVMPSFIGYSRKEIESIKQNYMLEIKWYGIPSEEKEGTCIAQFPEENCLYMPHQTVIVYYATTYTKKILCPCIEGHSLVVVKEFLEQNNIAYRCIETAETDNLNNDMYVVEQQPHPGYTLCKRAHSEYMPTLVLWCSKNLSYKRF